MNDDDLSRKIKQIAELLGQDSMPDNVKGLLSVLAGSLSGGEGTAPASPEAAPVRKEEPVQREEKENTEDTAAHARQMMERLNPAADPRVNLLNAIRPFMSNRRQQKIGNCIKILQLVNLTKLMDINDK